MVRKPSNILTDNELSIMKIIWERGESSVKDVQEGLTGEESPAYTTVMTFLQILEKKGYLKHRKEGKTYIYSATVTKEDAIDSDVGNIVKRFFDNSTKKLVVSLLKNENLTEEDILDLEKFIEEKKIKR